MSLFGRRMSPEILAAELLHGLESGEVVFEPPDEEAAGSGSPAPLDGRVAALVEKELLPLRNQLQQTVEQAAALFQQAEESRRQAAELLGQASAVLSEATRAAAALRGDGGGKPDRPFAETLGALAAQDK